VASTRWMYSRRACFGSCFVISPWTAFKIFAEVVTNRRVRDGTVFSLRQQIGGGEFGFAISSGARAVRSGRAAKSMDMADQQSLAVTQGVARTENLLHARMSSCRKPCRNRLRPAHAVKSVPPLRAPQRAGGMIEPSRPAGCRQRFPCNPPLSPA